MERGDKSSLHKDKLVHTHTAIHKPNTDEYTAHTDYMYV